MNRSESKYFATAAKMDDAFLALLEEKDFAYITVKEICTKAGVNRSTFYLHYETLGDLINESVERMNRQFQDSMGKDSEVIVSSLATCPKDELYLVTPEYLVPFLTYVKQHRRLFRTAMEKADVLNLHSVYDRMFSHVFAPILQRFNVPKADRSYLMAFFMQGMMAVIGEWLKGDCEDSVEHVASIIQACVASPLDRD